MIRRILTSALGLLVWLAVEVCRPCIAVELQELQS